MKHISIEGANAHPGQPKNWNPETDGTCGVLPVRVTWDGDRAKTCESAWVPSPEELALLNRGGSVVLTVAGWQVPVSLHVDPPLPLVILARNHVQANLWRHQTGGIGVADALYAYNAEQILGKHFRAVVVLPGFRERADALHLERVAESLVRPIGPYVLLPGDIRIEHDAAPVCGPGAEQPSGIEHAAAQAACAIANAAQAMATDVIRGGGSVVTVDDMSDFHGTVQGHLLTFCKAVIAQCALVAEIALAKTAASDIRKLDR